MEPRTSDCYREMLSTQPLILRIAEFFSGYSPPIFATLGIDVSTYYSVIMSPANSILENWKIPNTIYKEIRMQSGGHDIWKLDGAKKTFRKLWTLNSIYYECERALSWKCAISFSWINATLCVTDSHSNAVSERDFMQRYKVLQLSFHNFHNTIEVHLEEGWWWRMQSSQSCKTDLFLSITNLSFYSSKLIFCFCIKAQLSRN